MSLCESPHGQISVAKINELQLKLIKLIACALLST